MTQEYIPSHFGDTKYEWMSGVFQGIVELANSRNPTLVIDAGCGRNQYKPHIKNLVGFDPNPYQNADFRSSILEAEFEENSADVVLALGSVQFGTTDNVKANIRKLISWTKPGGLIIMRATLDEPGFRRHLENKKQLNEFVVDFHLWSYDFLDEVTKENNLKMFMPVQTKIVYYKRNTRVYKLQWVWEKPNV